MQQKFTKKKFLMVKEKALPVVIWGCDKNSETLSRFLVEENIPIAFYISEQEDFRDISFLGKPVYGLSALQNHSEDYFVLVSGEDDADVSYQLSSYGFYENKNFLFVSSLIGAFLNSVTHELFELLNTVNKNNKVFVILQPSLAEIRNPSSVEIGLQHWKEIISFKDRFPWLRSNPPHIRKAHKGLPQFSDEYIKNIFTCENPVLIDGVYSQPAHESTYVNVSNGMRHTSNQPLSYNSVVHCVGSSHTYGIGVEDYYTFPSSLQRCLQDKYPNVYKVQNYGVRGLTSMFYPEKIASVMLNENDILLCCLESNQATKTELAGSSLPHINLTDFLHRPHNLGEIFLDTHLNYRGTQHCAKIVSETFFDFETTKHQALNSSEKESYITQDPLFEKYLKYLKSYFDSLSLSPDASVGCIVMNCNPFTLGHQHLIELSSAMVDQLFVFVVEEDRSYFPFKDRLKLIKEATQNINNVHVLPSGQFIISNVTFPEYFDKDALQASKIDPSLDLNIFCKYVAKSLGITVRFAGEEPNDAITRQYNESMKSILPQHGLKFVEIPRKRCQGDAISASKVRTLLEKEKFDEIESYVPQVTMNYLKKFSSSGIDI